MFTIEEARISRPAATRRIPHGAALEYTQQDVQRALEDQDCVQECARSRFLHHQIDWILNVFGKVVAYFGPAMETTVGAGRNDTK